MDNKLNPVATYYYSSPILLLKGRVNVNGTIYSRKPEIYAWYLVNIERIMLHYRFYDFLYIQNSTAFHVIYYFVVFKV